MLGTFFEKLVSELILVVIVADLVEVIHIQLAHKAGIVVVLKVVGEHLFTQLVDVLNNECAAVLDPANTVLKLRILVIFLNTSRIS